MKSFAHILGAALQATEFALIVAAARKEVDRAISSKDRAALEAFAPSFAIKDGRLVMSHGGTVADLGSVIGPRGLDGFNGLDGRDGQSIKGDKGDPGRDGVDGKSIKGDKGDKGDPGADGEDGVGVASAYVSDTGFLVIELTDGSKITAGQVRGRDGKDGKSGGAVFYGGGVGAGNAGTSTAGADGASAYELAVENGFVGTVQEWLASLVGADGATGPQGPQGETGAAGPAGSGLPVGGTAGQIPVKSSGDDYAVGWGSVFRGLAMPMKPAAGVFIGPATSGGSLGTIAQAANRNTIAPFCPAFDLTIDQVAISVSTAVASSLAKVVIYSADADGRPSTILAESADIDCSTTGTKTTALSLSFTAGRIYWIGVRSSSTQTLRNLPAAAFPVLSYTSAATPAIQCVLAKTETYASAAADWTYSSSHHSNITVPIVLMRVA